MFQFPTYALVTLFIHVTMTKCLVWPGSPIRISTGQWLFAPLRSFSQLVTSFIAFWCLGIHPTLLVAWPLFELSSIFGFSSISIALTIDCDCLNLSMSFFLRVTCTFFCKNCTYYPYWFWDFSISSSQILKLSFNICRVNIIHAVLIFLKLVSMKLSFHRKRIYRYII